VKKTTTMAVLGLILCLAVLIGGWEQATVQAQDPLVLPVDQIIIKYKDDANLNQAAQAQASSQLQRLSDVAGASIDYFRPMSGYAHVMRLSEPLSMEDAINMTAQLAALPEVEYAEPDYKVFPLEEGPDIPLSSPNDTRYSELWHYFAPTAGTYGVNAPTAWDMITGASDVYIAILDTGITDHADLAGRWIGGYDLVSDANVANDGDGRDSDAHDPGDWLTDAESKDPPFSTVGCPVSDSSWHGTHVAGTIGAATNNNLGIAGLNWDSKIVPVRVLGKCFGYTSDIADGIRWAAGLSVPGTSLNSHPTKVINMSLGGYSPTGCSTTYQTAINAAHGEGATIVVSAGNSNANAGEYQPANCNNVVTVAATNRYGNRASYSNYGTAVDISAPGGGIGGGVLSTMNTGTQGPADDTYAFYQGTSMAAPHVSGVASLIYSLNPTLTPSQVLTILQSNVTAFPSGSTCNTSDCGSGIINAAAALAAVPDPRPKIPTLSPISNSSKSGSFTVDWDDVANADEYTLQEDDNSSFTSPSTAYGGTASQADINGKTGGTWYYRVRAENSSGTLGWSNTVSTVVKPDPPVLDAITNPGNTDSYSVTWSTSANADGYLLQEATTGTFDDATTRYMGADTQYTVTGQTGGFWYYRVRADSPSGTSDWSTTKSVFVNFSPLNPPNLLPITNPNQKDTFTIQWGDVLNATTYILEESDNPYFVNPVVVYSGAMEETLLTDRMSGNLYYRARAANASNQGPWSNSQSTEVQHQLYLPIVVSPCIPDPAGESNNIDDALIVCSGQIITGQVNDNDWDDVYRIYALSGEEITLSMSGTGGDADLYLFAPGSTDVNDDTPFAFSAQDGNDEFIMATLDTSGYWYIDVYSYLGTIDYSLSIDLANTTSQTLVFESQATGHHKRR
jgi:serine protease